MRVNKNLIPLMCFEKRMDEDAVLEELAATAMGGMSTHGIQATKDRMEREELGLGPEEEEEENFGGQPPPPPPPENFADQYDWKPSPIKVTKRMASEGRKGVQEKLEGVTSDAKAKILGRIEKYYQYFKELEPKGKKKRLTIKDSIEVLLIEERRCKNELSQANVLNSVKALDLFFEGFVLENGLKYMGLPVHGLAAEAKKSQHVMEQELKEFAIKYSDLFSAGPEWRYTVKLLQRIEWVMRRNGKMINAPMADFMDTQTEEEMRQRYSDL